jgi:hypothetical protein
VFYQCFTVLAIQSRAEEAVMELVDNLALAAPPQVQVITG